MYVILGAIALAACLLFIDLTSVFWASLTILFGLTVLVCQFLPWPLIRVYALFAAAFFVGQAIVSPYFLRTDYKTMRPNLDMMVDVVGGLRGISGKKHVTTDAKGYRTTGPIDYAAEPDGLRIFAIGGSTTEQIRMDDSQTWSAQLQEGLRETLGVDVEVANTGVSGLRAANHLATLKRIGDLHPDAAVFLLGANDWNHHIKLAFEDTVPVSLGERFTAWRDERRLSQSLIGVAMRPLVAFGEARVSGKAGPEQIVDRGEYFDGKLDSLARSIVHEFRPDTVLDDYANKLDQIISYCEEIDIQCIFFTQPNGYQEGASEGYKRTFWMTPPNQPYTLTFESLVYLSDLYNTYLKETAARRGVDLCDPASQMAASNDFFYDEMHFTEQGSDRIAELLVPCVAEALKNRTAG